MQLKRQNLLFPKAQEALERLGENIRLARRRRHITAKMMAARANVSVMTLRAIERGSASVSMSHYLSVLFCLGMHGDIARVAADDRVGRDLQDAVL